MKYRHRMLTIALVWMGVCSVSLAETNRVPGREVDERMTIHEWGTFTELQDEQAISLAGVNVDDEPVPSFVHGFASSSLAPARSPAFWMKGIPRRFPAVVTRLETPVIYFYPPSKAKAPIEVDVEVSYHGGWLSEFYPRADFEAPGLKQIRLEPTTVGRLRWNNLLVGTHTTGPETDEPVWVTPRATDAAMVSTSEGESEHYLFYRGVGSLPGPLRVSTDRLTEQLSIFTHFARPESAPERIEFPAAWLVHVRPDQTVAYRRVDSFSASESDIAPHAVVSSRFEDEAYAAANLISLKSEMHDMLVGEGLYPKEATAMLETWHKAYFTSPGLRVFYLVPEVLVNARMPLKVSVDATIARVMMGRVELISSEQRQILEQIKRAEVSSPKWMSQIPASEARQRFFAGRSDFGDLGVEIPADYQAYLDLGRFRNALIRSEHRLRPTEELQRFVANYRLQTVVDLSAVKSNPTEAETLTKRR